MTGPNNVKPRLREHALTDADRALLKRRIADLDARIRECSENPALAFERNDLLVDRRRTAAELARPTESAKQAEARLAKRRARDEQLRQRYAPRPPSAALEAARDRAHERRKTIIRNAILEKQSDCHRAADRFQREGNLNEARRWREAAFEVPARVCAEFGISTTILGKIARDDEAAAKADARPGLMDRLRGKLVDAA